MMEKSLSGKSALITGGSRGIGAATVRRLASDGAAVAFTYAVSDAKAAALVAEIQADGGQALAIKADSADPKALQRAVAETASRFGRLEILVNNVGHSTSSALRILTVCSRSMSAPFLSPRKALWPTWARAAALSRLAASRQIAEAFPGRRSTA
jgi:NAD(P)-dependent dehydrogenase (short-subunit alcohol dehydrogenase family)